MPIFWLGMEKLNLKAHIHQLKEMYKQHKTRMWANAQLDGRPAKHRWHPLFNAAKFG